jgi:hypothetical protein
MDINRDRSVRWDLWRGLVCFILGAMLAAGMLQGYHSIREWQVHSDHLSKRKLVRPGEAPSPKAMVALVVGEANADNFGESPVVAAERVYDFYKGRLYKAEEPLLGGDVESGDSGSVWVRLANMLVTRGVYEEVVLVQMAVKESTIARWRPGTELHRELLKRIRDAQEAGLTFTHILWSQGESDARLSTDPGGYRQAFQELLGSIREHGVTAPMFVAIATLCYSNKINLEIQQAQRSLVGLEARVHAGPNTDDLGMALRFDGCHFANEGLDKAAGLWFETLTQRAQPIAF